MPKLLIHFIVKLLCLKAQYRNQFSYTKFFRVDRGVRIKILGDGKVKLLYNPCFERNVDINVDNGQLTIGSRVYMNLRCMISCKESIEIGNNCLFGPDVKIYDNDHVYDLSNGVKADEHRTNRIIIGKNCWIGSNCVILRGTVIGDNSIIAAGTIVKGVFPEGSLVKSDLKYTVRRINESTV